MVGVAFLAPDARANSLSVATVEAKVDDQEIRVPVTLEITRPIGGYSTSLAYDPRHLKVVDLIAVDASADFDFFATNLTDPGTIVVTAVADFVGGASVDPLGPGSHRVFELILAPVPGVRPGTSPIWWIEGALSDPTGSELIQPSLSDGAVLFQESVHNAIVTWSILKGSFRR